MAPPRDGRQPPWPEGRDADARAADSLDGATGTGLTGPAAARTGAARAGGAGRGEADDEARLTPRERAAIDRAVVRVGRRGRSPIAVAALVAGAFALGLLRPWELVLPASAGVPTAGPAAVAGEPGVTDGTGGEAGGVDGRAQVRGNEPPVDPGAGVAAGSGPAPVPPRVDPTCGYPGAWRLAAIQEWAGARARVWAAAEAVAASGPDDPAIPFHPVASDVVEAIGWCAPVRGDDRPPLSAVGTLFRLRDGVAAEVPVDRLEPAAPDALGELWLPRPLTVGRRPTWAAGRYVIRLAAPSGGYVRFLGLEVRVPPRASSTPSPSDPAPPWRVQRSRGGVRRRPRLPRRASRIRRRDPPSGAGARARSRRPRAPA